LGYPLYYLAELLDVKFTTVFMWFHSFLPFIIGIVLYFISSHLFNWKVGLCSIIITTLVSGASVYYIYQGILFNLLNIAIFYPLLFYFMAKWFVNRRWYQLMLTILFTFLVVASHVSGLYLPAVVVLTLVVYLAYTLINKGSISSNIIILSVSFNSL